MPHKAILLYQGVLANLQQLGNQRDRNKIVAVDDKLSTLLKWQHEQPVWPRSVWKQLVNELMVGL
jgi:hypothetical protein